MDEFPKLQTYHFYEKSFDNYEELYQAFDWEIPDRFNIANYACERWATGGADIALLAERAGGASESYTYDEIDMYANMLANRLEEQGIEREDRIAITGLQTPETLISLFATWKMGCVAVPVSALLGPDGLEYRLSNCDVRVFIAAEPAASYAVDITENVDSVESIILMDGSTNRVGVDFWDTLDSASTRFNTVETAPDDSAAIIYTSGTTGNPKGVVHAHQALLGQLPGFIVKHLNAELGDEETIWALPEWSWIGNFNFILPSLFYGKSVVGYEYTNLDPRRVLGLIERHGVTFAAFVPTAIRMMMDIDDVDDFDLSSVRVMGIGGETVGEDVLDWVEAAFADPVINVGYGQTECILPIGQCDKYGKNRDGSIGVALPGHTVKIVDPQTAEPIDKCGEIGEIAVKYERDPMCFKEYWEDPEGISQKVKNGWLLTEDLGSRDEDGYFWFESRKDNVIISSGYRIGPEEVEENLMTHDAVSLAAVIGVPDEIRGEIPKAYIELSEGYAPGGNLKSEIQRHVKERLAKYEYPREISFLEQLPQTTSNKVNRSQLHKIHSEEHE